MKLKAMLAAVLLSDGILLCGCAQAEPEVTAPERVSLYIEQESRIVTLDYGEYLAGCIFAVADPSFQRETLLAVGIACSGQAAYSMSGGNGDSSGWFGADIAVGPEDCPEWLSREDLEQEYGDEFEEYWDKVAAVAEEAAVKCPYFEGVPANTLLCSISAGVTDDGGEPYLPSLRLPADKESRYYSCAVRLTEEIVRKSISETAGTVALPADREQWFTEAKHTKSGSLLGVRFGGAELSGEQLRQALELRSTNISVEYSGGMFTFTTLGEGNNVGMSVYTAEMLARRGKSAEEILEQFYPGIELKMVKR